MLHGKLLPTICFVGFLTQRSSQIPGSTQWKRASQSGISAGSICWFEEGLTDSLPGRLTALSCLGLLKGSNCPHYDGESNRRPVYQRFIKRGKIKPGLAADDGVALHFIGKKLTHVVSSRPNAYAYSVKKTGNGAVEDKIAPKYLKKG